MKQFILIATLIAASMFITSCGDNLTQVMYKDGKVEWVGNKEHISVRKGDSLIIQHYLSFSSSFNGNDQVYGYYQGIVPDRISGNDYSFWYDVAVVVKP